MKTTKILVFLLALVMVISCFAGCKPKDSGTDDTKPTEQKKEYTFKTYTAQLGTNWNPHTWKTENDSAILQYLETPLVMKAIADSEEGTYQWAYKAAESISDVTAGNKNDLTKYQVTLPAGKTADQVSEGYVFEIKLNPDMMWEDGTAINADTYIYSMEALLNPITKNYRASQYCTGTAAVAGGNAYNSGSSSDFAATVGCYKVDEFTIHYVTQSQTDINEFLNACTSNWLVYEGLYATDAAKYATSKETTMSYGPYKIDSLQAGKQIVLVQNENYYQYEKQADGTLYAETDYEVDGEAVQAYQTTKIVVDVMTNEAAQQAFLKGELSEWIPTADEMTAYNTSERMYLEAETDTYSFFFNTNLDALKEMDQSKGNQNSIVLSNQNFRKAFSLAINRGDWVTATPGYKPSYTLINEQFYYNIYNDPRSTYRGSPQAMQAMVDLYGLHWVDGSQYNTLPEAHTAITGYDLAKAKELMKTACKELVNTAAYTVGQDIKIRVAYTDGPMDDSCQAQIEKVNGYLNAAAEGSGFGKITLVGEGDIQSRYEKVPAGEYAIGYGAMGGEAQYPFHVMQKFCETQGNKIQELGCWNPATEELTITLENKKVTKTWQDWARSLVGAGSYADAAYGIKLEITARMEEALLAKYYRIPVAASCTAFLQSYQAEYYTDTYNIMYGFGGLELMTYNYTDAQWAEHVAKEGGTLNYE